VIFPAEVTMPLRKVRDADDARTLLEQSANNGTPRASGLGATASTRAP